MITFTIPDVTQIPYTSRGSTYWYLKTGSVPVYRSVSRPTTRSATTARRAQQFPARRATLLVPWTIGVAGLLRRIVAALHAVHAGLQQHRSGGDAGGVAYVRTTTNR